MTDNEIVPIKLNPRAFTAFGADLVTNDSVAITELVKNSYDAFAYNVCVEFGEDGTGQYIQIEDDGLGMTRDVIKNSWAVIATPYKENNPIIMRDGVIRRVSGKKGLGRFSAARLGNILHIWTKSPDESCLKVSLDWDVFTKAGDMKDCVISIEEVSTNTFFENTGTIIRIEGLNHYWDEDEINELGDNLSRLLSPFKTLDSFSIILKSLNNNISTELSPSKLIENPLYKIRGNVDKYGKVLWTYAFSPQDILRQPRIQSGQFEWKEGKLGFDKAQTQLFNWTDDKCPYSAGPFDFEIRVWDLDSDTINEFSEAFDLKRKEIRNTISQYKGLSIYRDGILVLPKSPASKDWLGIDLKRVSRIGERISTSQIIGIINISSEANPELRDTTDREKLVDTKEYQQFTQIVQTVIKQLQNLRLKDKIRETEKSDKTGLKYLFASLSSESLVNKIEDAIENFESPQNILDYVRDYNSENEKNLTILQNRLVYYAQTASLGSVAIVILHELLNELTIIKRFIRNVANTYSPLDPKTQEYLDDATKSHARLIDVAKSFAPLYRKNLHKGTHVCQLRESVDNSIRLIQSIDESKGVTFVCDIPEDIMIKMHSGELQTIFINLLENACYWIQNKGADKKIEIIAKMDENGHRINIQVSDTGSGISQEDAQYIFDPGVTSKPHGIGMGLVIVTEILNYYDGKIGIIMPGILGGATFLFDVPLAINR